MSAALALGNVFARWLFYVRPACYLKRMAFLYPLVLGVLLLTGCGSKQIIPYGGPAYSAGATSAVVRTAQTQVGKMYRYGGSSPSAGFDCSGLIWWAYRENGIMVPRVTADQARAGTGVSRQNMQAGDILVFNTSSGTSGLHTGLYAGNGRFVHSPRSGKRIRYDFVNDKYWGRRLTDVRRVVR